MSRETTIPAQQVREDISRLEEIPPSAGNPGAVRVQVGRVDAKGKFIVPQQHETFEIKGAHYAALTGDAAPWAPDKPAGTYRNSDLWHFIDLLRAA